MKPDEILTLCRKARDVGTVKHEDYADHIVVMSRNKKRDDGTWEKVETAYMAVDGRLAMANEDHRKQGKRLDLVSEVLVDTADSLTVRVTATSEIYGVRTGTATSRRKTGAPVEREFPYEVAETSAIGRALGAMGYGLLPGTGLTSAEDMLFRVGDGSGASKKAKSAATAAAPKPEIKTCPVHQVPMRQFPRKDGKGTYFAHQDAGKWCYGKSQPAAVPTDEKAA